MACSLCFANFKSNQTSPAQRYFNCKVRRKRSIESRVTKRKISKTMIMTGDGDDDGKVVRGKPKWDRASSEESRNETEPNWTKKLNLAYKPKNLQRNPLIREEQTTPWDPLANVLI